MVLDAFKGTLGEIEHTIDGKFNNVFHPHLESLFNFKKQESSHQFKDAMMCDSCLFAVGAVRTFLDDDNR